MAAIFNRLESWSLILAEYLQTVGRQTVSYGVLLRTSLMIVGEPAQALEHVHGLGGRSRNQLSVRSSEESCLAGSCKAARFGGSSRIIHQRRIG